ncbi:hypothetical protein LDENG_00077370 [Lucifuga dentata]|nr:hypothetical protein LDENG_00077370 [Lucifuga dentata]
MTGCCITYKHGIAQISVVTKEEQTHNNHHIYSYDQRASKNAVKHKTQAVSTGFSIDSSHVKIHQIYQSCSSSEDKVYPPFCLYKEFNDTVVQYIGTFQFQNPLCVKKNKTSKNRNKKSKAPCQERKFK